jgi:hypothetical protein
MITGEPSTQKITPHDIYLMRELRKEGLKYREIAEKFELATGYCRRVILGQAGMRCMEGVGPYGL